MSFWGKTSGIGFAGVLALAGLLAALAAAPAAAAPTWLATTDLSASGQEAAFPLVAMDSAGDAVAVWERSNGTNFIIEASRRPVGGSWSAPAPLSAPGQEAERPQVAMDAGGDAIAVWERFNGTNWIAEAASLPAAGGSWSAPVPLSAAGQEAENPRVAMDAGGDAVVTWRRFNGTNWIVEASSRVGVAGAWSSPVPLSAAGQDAENPRLAISGNGDAVSVWQRSNGTNLIVEAASFTIGGAWSAPVPLSAAGQDAEVPHAAMDAGGDAVVTWERFDGANFIIEATTRPAGSGSWSAPVPLSASGQSAFEQRVAMDAGGDAIAVWARSNGANFIVEEASRAAGGAWGAPVALSAGGEEAEEPRIAMDAGGDAVAAWLRSNGTNQILEATRRPVNGSWGAPVPLTAPGQNAEEPWVAMDAGGDAIAAWARFNGTNTGIQAVANDAAGPLLRNLAVPAAGLTGQPLAFSVSPLDAFSALGATTWSFGDGATATGTSATHAFAKPGTYSVTLASADVLGNASSATRTVTVAQALARVARKAKVKGKLAQLKLSCLTAGTCSGTLTLSAKAKLFKKAKGAKRSKAAKKPKLVQIGSAPFSLAAGKHATVAVKLSAKSLALLAKKGSLAVTLGGTGVQPGPVQLKVAKASKKHPRGGHRTHH